jgi:NADH oxidase (H2O2-forming)
VIVGGSAAGLTAGITSRRFYPDKKILIVRKEERVLIPCGIPYIYGTLESPDKNLIPDAVLQKNNIDLVVGEAERIEKEKKVLKVGGGQDVKYDKLIIATGSEPMKPPIEGSDKENVFVIKKDIGYLTSMLDKINKSKDVVIIGGGFIGMEFADECKKNRDINISIIEKLSHCFMLTFDKETCKYAEDLMKEKDIDVITGVEVQSITGDGEAKGVKLGDGKVIDADTVLIGIGAKPNAKIAERSGIKVNQRGAVLVDKYMRTSEKDIFACGDCCEKFSFFTGKPSNLMLASIATNEARIAGANLYKINRVNEGVIGTFSTVIGETALSRAGISEKEAEKNNYDIVIGTAEACNCHPGCMPCSSNLKVSLIFEKGSGVLLGGELTGAKSGGELINLISGCIHERMIADDIATFQMGTHPALTASPIAYQISNAAEIAIKKLKE